MKYLIIYTYLLGYLSPVFSQSLDLVPELWLRADKLQARTLTWYDFSGNGRHTGVSYGRSLKQGISFNYGPSLMLTNADDYFMAPYDLTDNYEMTLMAVYQLLDSSAVYGMFQTHREHIDPYQLSTYDLGDTLAKPYHNIHTLCQYWGYRKPTIPDNKFFIGTGNLDPLNNLKGFRGYIAEVIMFDEILEHQDRVIWETYLAIKYGVSNHKQDYILHSGKVVWHADSVGGYQHYLAGIGRSIPFALYQKQSSSVSEANLLSIGLNVIASTNLQNSATLQEEEAIIWGNDGAELVFQDEYEGSYYEQPILTRKWRIEVSLAPGQSYQTSLEFDLPQIRSDYKGKVFLLINRSSDKSFSSSEAEWIEADSLSSTGKVHFSQVEWDTDGSGEDFFTFAISPILNTTTTPISCFQSTDGKIDVEVVGGVAPFDVKLHDTLGKILQQFSRNSPQFDINGLAAGVYDLSITESKGGIATSRVVVDTAPFLFSYLPSRDTIFSSVGKRSLWVDLSHLDASVKISTYQWLHDGSAYAQTPVIEVTQAGVYTVRITTDKGCTIEDTVDVYYLIEPELVVKTTSVSCKDDVDGMIAVEFKGGEGPYHYTLLNGFQRELSTWSEMDETDTIRSLPAGDYIILGKDQVGNDFRKEVTIENQPMLTLSLPPEMVLYENVDSVQITSIFPLATGREKYVWQYRQKMFSNTPSIWAKDTGTYTVVVTTENGCVVSDSVHVVSNPPLTFSVNQTSLSCFGANDGTIEVTILSGEPPYLYKLSDENGRILTRTIGYNPTEILGTLGGGRYALSVTSGYSVQTVKDIAITTPPYIYTTLTDEMTLNIGEEQNLEVQVNLPDSVVAYRWYKDRVFYGVGSAIVANGEGTYVVSLETTTGCTLYDTTKVRFQNAPIEEEIVEEETVQEKIITPVITPNGNGEVYDLSFDLPEVSPVGLFLYTTDGELVYTERQNDKLQHTFTLSLQRETPYILLMETNSNREVFKIISTSISEFSIQFTYRIEAP